MATHARTFVFGVDSPADYGPDFVCRAMGLRGFGFELEPSRFKCELRVLFLPSFEPEVYVAVELDGQGPAEIRSLGTSLWSHECSLRLKANGKWEPSQVSPQPPVLDVRQSKVSPMRRRRLSKAFHRLLSQGAPQGNSAGLDGTWVEFALTDGTAAMRFTEWSPKYDLAAKLAHEAWALTRTGAKL